MATFSVIVPALNEEGNLRRAVDAILQEIGPRSTFLEVLVFDDASTDRTGEIADQLAAEHEQVRVFHNPRRLNIGGIYQAGIREARGEYVFLIPGDNEIRVDEVARGLKYLDQADLIIFYVTNVQVRSWLRQRLSRMYAWLVNVLFGTDFSYTNGTNVFRTDVIRRMPVRTNGFSYQTEAVVKAVWSGVDFVHVGIEITTRAFGTSKAISWKNLQNVAVALGGLWWEVRVKERDRYRRLGRMVGMF